MGRGLGPSPPKAAATNGPTTMHSQMPGNLFPSHKLKGNNTLTTQAATIEYDMAKEHPGVEPEREEETDPSGDEEVEALRQSKGR